jgi:hypothetical protein
VKRVHFQPFLLWAFLVGAIGVIAACGGGSATSSSKPSATLVHHEEGDLLLDFETPNPAVTWQAPSGPATAPDSTMPAASSQPSPPPLTRSTLRPESGLWCLAATLRPELSGDIWHAFSTPINLQNQDTLLAGIMHTDSPARSGEWTANVVLRDEAGKEFVGDAYAITTQWQDALLDLHDAATTVDLSHIAGMGLRFQHVRGTDEPLTIQTDTWTVRRDHHAYVGARFGMPRTFYVQRDGSRLTVGMVNQYEITFFQRAGTARPWMTISQNVGTEGASHRQMVLGQDGTGLMLLDQNSYDALGTSVRQDAVTPSTGTPNGAIAPALSWPIASADTSVRWTWACEWASTVAAIIEVKQEVGPYDRLGQPAVALKWRFMIYQWGQVFVHVEWTKGTEATSDPMSWALALDNSTLHLGHQDVTEGAAAGGAERLLAAIYPASVHEGLTTALPHEMQKDAPVAMLAKNDEKNTWWWAAAGDKRLFGVGIGHPGTTPLTSLDCMLLVNGSSPLMQAGTFSQYLVPPKVRTREGELDRNFPGDADNDSLVEPYGFQVIRLSHGRAAFTVYPQGRPLFYPPFLFTVLAIERDADDLNHSRMLINIDGNQFADPPQFPDGSFLLQMPYVLDRPLQVEAVVQQVPR